MRTLMAAMLVLVGAAVSVAKEGTLVVLNKAEASASLISLATGEEAARVPTGEGPHEVAVSPDGSLAVVADYGAQAHGHTLTVIDVAQAERVRTIELGLHRPHGIVFLDERRVIVTTELEKRVAVVDVATGEVVGSVETGQDVTHMVAVTPDGSRAFTANIGSGTATAIDLEAMEVIGQIETGRGAEGIDVSPDGREVWVSNRAANTVSVIDAATLEVVEQIDCGDFPIRLKFTPDGKHVLVSNARSAEVAVFDAASREEVARTKLDPPEGGGAGNMLGASGAVPIGVLIPPDGERAYIAATNADFVAVLELGSWEVVGRLEAGREPDGMAWSPVEVRAGKREGVEVGS